jgi:hypothetical protein
MLTVRAEHRTIFERSDELTVELVLPPADGPDVCPRCRSWNDTGADECSNCDEVSAALGDPALRLRVMSLYMKPSPLRDWLTQYKGRLSDADEPHVPEYAALVRALLGRFLIERGADLADILGPVEGLVVVPSTDRRPPHPLVEVLSSLDLDIPVLDVLQRGPGQLGFRRPHPEGYRIQSGVRLPARALLIDDVYTTGSRANSAAHALRTHGVHVAGFVAIARRINPAWRPEVAAIWERQQARPYDWSQIPL